MTESEALIAYLDLALTSLAQDELIAWASGRAEALKSAARAGEEIDRSALREFIYRTEGRLSWDVAQKAASLLDTLRSIV